MNFWKGLLRITMLFMEDEKAAGPNKSISSLEQQLMTETIFIKIWVVLIFVTVGFFPLHAQDTEFPRDTSYTTQSAYQKYIKDYPNIEIVKFDVVEQGRVFKNIPYKNTGKRDLTVDVFAPFLGSKAGHPAILLVHGGGWISGNKKMLHPMAKKLADEGYVAVTVEYRLSPEAEYPAAVYDIKTALKWMKDHAERFNIDTSKVAILGTSAGGQLAALVGTTAHKSNFEDPADTSDTSVKVHAIIDIDGVLAFIHPVSEEGNVAGKWLGGSQEEARAVWIEASALTHIGKQTPPMLFIGSAFPRFLAGRKDAIEILNYHDIRHETHIFEDAPHSFWLFNPWFDPTMEVVISYLNEL